MFGGVTERSTSVYKMADKMEELTLSLHSGIHGDLVTPGLEKGFSLLFPIQ